MELRPLGESGLEVPPLCLGGNVFGWTADEATSFRILDRAFEHGLNFIDTADVYSNWVDGNQGGESETIIGRWLAERRNRASVTIATKVGYRMVSGGKRGLSRDYIRSAVEASLRRLQTDCIELYQAHREDVNTPLEETLAAFAELIEEGKIKAFGASNQSVARLNEALEVSARNGLPKYASLQPEYNLYDRSGVEEELAGICIANRVGIISYYSLASGFLTGKYRSLQQIEASPRKKELNRYFDARGSSILAALDTVALARNVPVSAVSLAWVMAQPGITAPISSASSEAQVDQLAIALDLDLTAAELALLDDASRPGTLRDDMQQAG